MKTYNLFFTLLFLITSAAFSQERISHTITKGETVYSIAKKYKVKTSDIFDLNPQAKNVLKLNSVLMIPNKGYKPEEKSSKTTVVVHEVLSKETLYGISKKYKVSIDQITQANPSILTEGLKLGSKITIPGASQSAIVLNVPEKSETKPLVKEVKEIVKPEIRAISDNATQGDEVRHLVLPKETKYGISKQYKISVVELEKLNPEIVNGLSVGYSLVIKKGAVKETTQTKPISSPVEEEEEEEVEQEVVKIMQSGSSQIKVVEVKETAPIVNESATAESLPLSADNVAKADFLIAKASENIGVRYRTGGTSKAGFDCSGLMITTFKELDLALPRTSSGQSTFGTRVEKVQAQKGDLIFFTTNGRGNINHVGMVTEVSEDEIKFIHSSVQAGVIISSTKEPYYSKRFVQVNRVLN